MFDPRIAILSLCGLLLSIYTLNVIHAAHRRRHVLCDLGPHISCTRAFTSPYASILGIKNAWIGIAYYTSMFVLSWSDVGMLRLILALCGVLASLPLAYLSYIRMHNFCLVCTSTYLVNILLVIASVQ